MLSVSVLFVLSSPGLYNAFLLSRNTQIPFYTANWIHRHNFITHGHVSPHGCLRRYLGFKRLNN